MPFTYTGIRVRHLRRSLAFWERDVDRKYKEMLANGATKAVEPFSEGGYRLAFVKDPDGIWIELLGKERRARRRGS